jgi:DNA-directed RNA polymerase specialized sigma54-like protein
MPQSLTMTPQLQQAIKLLTMPFAEVRALLESEAERLGLRRLADDEVDPLDQSELAAAEEEHRAPWTFSRSVLGAPEADVWRIGDRLISNGSVPRFVVPSGGPDKEATWLMNAVRQRAKTFQRVASALVEANQPWLDGTEATPARVSKRALVQSLGMHSSTLDRVAHAGMMETARGLSRFETFLRT